MIKLSFREPVYQEKTTKEGLKVITCIIMYRPKGIECHGGPGFTEAVGLDNRYRRLLSSREAALAYKPLVSASERLAVMHLSPTPKPRPEVRLASNAQSRLTRSAGRPRF